MKLDREQWRIFADYLRQYANEEDVTFETELMLMRIARLAENVAEWLEKEEKRLMRGDGE